MKHSKPVGDALCFGALSAGDVATTSVFLEYCEWQTFTTHKSPIDFLFLQPFDRVGFLLFP